MINTKKFQHLNRQTWDKHEEWKGFTLSTLRFNIAYEIILEWVNIEGYTLLNVCVVEQEIYVTYETNDSGEW